MTSSRFLVSAALAASLLAALAASAAADPQPAPMGAGLEVPPTPGSMTAQSAMGTRPVMPAVALLGRSNAAVQAGPGDPPSPTTPPPAAAMTGPSLAGPALAAPVAAPAPSDATVVSNGPVPDTAANRAKYGQPLSRAGKATDPAGN
jgi:hypothetical protein